MSHKSMHAHDPFAKQNPDLKLSHDIILLYFSRATSSKTCLKFGFFTALISREA